MNRKVIVVAVVGLLLVGCSTVSTPRIFEARTQSPYELRAIDQKLLDLALSKAIAKLNFAPAKGRKVFVEVNSEFAAGLENIRYAVLTALKENGIDGIVENSADADVTVGVNPAVYGYQMDQATERVLFYGLIADKHSATVKIVLAITDRRTNRLEAVSSGEAYATLEKNLASWFWLFKSTSQTQYTLEGSALEALSTKH